MSIYGFNQSAAKGYSSTTERRDGNVDATTYLDYSGNVSKNETYAETGNLLSRNIAQNNKTKVLKFVNK